MDYKYLYLRLKIELMDNLNLTNEQWEEIKNFIRKEEIEQLRICGVVKSFYCYDNKYCGVKKKCDKQCENCELIEND